MSTTDKAGTKRKKRVWHFTDAAGREREFSAECTKVGNEWVMILTCTKFPDDPSDFDDELRKEWRRATERVVRELSPDDPQAVAKARIVVAPLPAFPDEPNA